MIKNKFIKWFRSLNKVEIDLFFNMINILFILLLTFFYCVYREIRDINTPQQSIKIVSTKINEQKK